MSTKTNLLLDLGIFTAFLAVTNPHLTGNTVHEWLSLAFAVAILAHLLLHWRWLVKITGEFFKKFIHRSRLNYIVDALFFIALTGAIFSGLLISKEILSTLGIQLSEVSRGWKSIHSLTSNASMLLLGIHFALHWKWVVTHIRRYILAPIYNLFHRPAPTTLAVRPVRVNPDK
jgi:hypothetical protein